MDGFKNRFRAAGVHLAISLVIAATAASFVFGVLYPFPFREVSGGLRLFGILVGVDVVVGPMLTWLVFNQRKPKDELRRDLTIIAALQLVALAYGLWSMYMARPVYLVHEVDRFVVVSASDVDPADLKDADSAFQTEPALGIQTIGLRDAKDAAEKLKSIELALAGKDLSLQPRFWQSLSNQNSDSIRQRARPLDALGSRSDDTRRIVNQWLADRPGNASDYLAFPLVSREHYWTVVLDKNLNMVGYLPIDPF